MDDRTVLLCLIGVLVVLGFLVANWFSEVAEDKRYDRNKYFWICFLFPCIGYVLVIALPDKTLLEEQKKINKLLEQLATSAQGPIAAPQPAPQPTVLSDELPDL